MQSSRFITTRKSFDYAPDKQKVLRHGGQLYTVSPYALLWNNDAYYMIDCYDRRRKEVEDAIVSTACMIRADVITGDYIADAQE